MAISPEVWCYPNDEVISFYRLCTDYSTVLGTGNSARGLEADFGPTLGSKLVLSPKTQDCQRTGAGKKMW